MKIYSRYYLIFAFSACLLLAAVFLLNLAVDPFDVWGSSILPSLELVKTEKFNHERAFKARYIQVHKPKVIMLGSSRVFIGIDPQHYRLINGSTAYNLGLGSANIYEIKRYFQHAYQQQPGLKQVIIGLDFFSFNKLHRNSPDFEEGRLGQDGIYSKDLLAFVNFNTTKASVRTLMYNMSHEADASFYSNGQMNELNLRRKTQDKPMTEVFSNSLSDFLNDTGGSVKYAKFVYAKAQLDSFREIVTVCRQNDIDLQVFVSPTHVTDLEAIKAAGLWPVFEQWKRDLSKVTNYWDFDGYNSITTEPINGGMKNFWDQSHYRKEIGNLVLDRMFHNEEEVVPRDFGVLITPQNLESSLTKTRHGRELWEARNPDVVKWVKSLKTVQ